MIKSIIVAISKNYAIGKNNKIPWNLPKDLNFFKKVTSNHIVIMGKNTFLSLPNGKLPNRINIVISKSLKQEDYKSVIIVKSLDEAINLAENKKEKEVFIIGGESVYKQAIDLADKLYITSVDVNIFKADTFFPRINFSKWKKVYNKNFYNDKNHNYNFKISIYNKRSK